MENNEHFCIRHLFNSIKNWWVNSGLDEIDAALLFLCILAGVLVFLCILVGVLVVSCGQKYVQFAKDNTDTSCCADTICICKITTLDMSTFKCFSETIYISE